MKLPNAHLALIGQEKITDYLLNAGHPDNGGKAAYFYSLGFLRNEWETFARELRNMALSAQVTQSLESGHGLKYIVDGAIATPNGMPGNIRTIWIVDSGRNCPRLVTAYPLR